jgi:acyl dehydratase
MGEMTPVKIEYQELAAGYEFQPARFKLDSEKVKKYLDAVEDASGVYEERRIVPPMAAAALAMAALSSALVLPPGTVHVSQELEFTGPAAVGETLTSRARVERKVARGKFHMLTIGIKVTSEKQAVVLSGETGFILPLPVEGK